MSFISVHEDVAVTVIGSGFVDNNFLMPAMLPAYRIRLDRKDQVLVNACVFPRNA